MGTIFDDDVCVVCGSLISAQGSIVCARCLIKHRLPVKELKFTDEIRSVLIEEGDSDGNVMNIPRYKFVENCF